MLHRASLCLALASIAPAAQAARPMVTDDARTVDAKSCQMESWMRFNRGGRELWALPACNFTGNLELTLGGGVLRGDDGSRTNDVVIQGKTLFKPLETGGYGLGLVLGTVRHPAINTRSNQLGDVYGYLPASFSFAQDRVVVHTNVGALRSGEERRNHGTWGVGTEILVTPATYAIAESFGPATGKSYVQVGVRHWLVPNRVQIDATWGERLHEGASERWYSLGLRLLTPAFLP